VKGVFTELDRAITGHRLSLAEIERAGFNVAAMDLRDVVAFMAKCEKLGSRVEEPAEVQGNLPVFLPPNAMGDEAYTACYYAINFNGLGLAGIGDELVAVRPEMHPRLPRPGGTWNRDRILSTELFHLGYLRPDPILRQYRDKLGSSLGHAVLEKRSNIVIVVDAPQVLDSVRAMIDTEVLEAMGTSISNGPPLEAIRRQPSLGAVASKEALHFYLQSFARSRQVPLAAALKAGSLTKHYPDADLWTSEEGYQFLAAEYATMNRMVRDVRDGGPLMLDDPGAERTISPREQKRLAIRFGLAGPAPVESGTNKSRKSARKR
jgi:hypothetical protein